MDRSLYAKGDREGFKKVVEELGGRWVLVCFRVVDKEVLWRRIEERRKGRGALKEGRKGDAAYEIERGTFEAYWEGFEWPVGEGEVDVVVD